MLIKEIHGKFIHHYSDTNKYIKQLETGNLYDYAIDVVEYTYEETELEIEKEAE